MEEIKKVAPEFDITSNWFNTVFVPDDINVTDYISGDFSPTDGVDSARFDGRIMQSFGRNWDIMSWGINFPVHHVKGPVQLMQEASVIMALGGGFQVYNMQSPQYTVMDEWAIPYWAEISEFCRARKEFAHNGKIVPDIGVVYSAAAYYDSIDCLFTSSSEYSREFAGTLFSICDTGRSVSVLNEQRLDEYGLKDYGMIVVPNAAVLGKDVKKKLLEYAENGGNLVLCGVDTVKYFAKETGAEVVREYSEDPVMRIEGEDYKVEVRRNYADVRLSGAESLATMTEGLVDGDMKCTNPPPSINFEGVKMSAFLKKDFGKGTIALMPVNLGRFYAEERTFEHSRLIERCLGSYGKGLVSVNTHGDTDVLLTEKNGKRYIHVINLLGEHRVPKVKTFVKIPPVYGVEVRYKAPRPAKAILRPENREIPFVYENGGSDYNFG